MIKIWFQSAMIYAFYVVIYKSFCKWVDFAANIFIAMPILVFIKIMKFRKHNFSTKSSFLKFVRISTYKN